VQLGVGTQGGCEAAVHATRRYTYNHPDDKVIVKLDFANAFNSVRRNALLQAVARDIPELYRFIYAKYEKCNPILKFGNFVISSAEGDQHLVHLVLWSFVLSSIL